MADRWTDEREPLDWRERQERAQRNRREEYGAQDGAQDYGDRSFQPRSGYGREETYQRSGYDREDPSRTPVFGERQSGSDYTGPRYGAGGYYGYTGQDDRERGGPAYGGEGRERGYRQTQHAAENPYGGAYGYGQARFEATRPSHDDHAYRVAYGDRQPDYQGRYDNRGDDRHEDGRGRNFWERASERVASWFGEMDYDRDRRPSDGDAYRAAHRGRGPSGYKRSDERISEEVHDLLTDDPWVDASGIVISVSAGEVTLSGTVLEREAKHRAERIVENLAGVTHVQNNLRVQKANPLTDAGRGFGDSAAAAQMGEASNKRSN